MKVYDGQGSGSVDSQATTKFLDVGGLHDETPRNTLLKSELFSFVPSNMKRCQNLFPGQNKDYSQLWPEEMVKKFRNFKKATNKHKGKITEGFSAQLPEQVLTYIHLVRAPFVKTVCETGFNAGHSTFMWLASNPKVRVFSFDIRKHGYAKPMADALSNLFVGRLTVTWGNSLETLPTFRQNNPSVNCDIVIVDGGHTTEIAQADMDNFRPMTSKQNLVVLDDYPTTMANFNRTLGMVWEGEKRKGNLREIFKCGFMPARPRGFSVGQLLL